MLARPGHLATQRLIEQLGFDPSAASNTVFYDLRSHEDVPDRDFWGDVHYRDGPFEVPDGVREVIDRNAYFIYRIDHPTLARVEIGGDPDRLEYLLLGVSRLERPAWQDFPAKVMYSPRVYAAVFTGQGWELVDLSTQGGRIETAEDAQSVVDVQREMPFTRIPRGYDDLQIGAVVHGLPPGLATPERAIGRSD